MHPVLSLQTESFIPRENGENLGADDKSKS
jgi:hypothetical protein